VRVRGASQVRGSCAHRHAQLPRDTLRVALGAGCHMQTSGCLNCRRRMAMNEALRHAPCTPKLHDLKERNRFSLPCDFQVPGVGANVLRVLSDLGWVSSSRIAAAAPEPQRNLRRAQGGGLRHNRFEAARTTLSWTTLDRGRMQSQRKGMARGGSCNWCSFVFKNLYALSPPLHERTPTHTGLRT